MNRTLDALDEELSQKIEDLQEALQADFPGLSRIVLENHRTNSGASRVWLCQISLTSSHQATAQAPWAVGAIRKALTRLQAAIHEAPGRKR